MTVPVEIPTIRYIYTAPAVLSFNYKVYLETDLEVRFIDVDNSVKILTLNADYTVALNPVLNGGTVNVTYVPPGGYGPPPVYLEIVRKLPLSQVTDWINGSPFNMDILERDLDRAVMLIQELYAALDAIFETSSWRGVWATGLYYNIRDVVKGPDSNYYMAAVSHTSGVWAADLAVPKWILLIDITSITATLTAFTALSDTPSTLVGQALKQVRVNAGETALEFVSSAFLSLIDSPSSFVGQALKFPRVNAVENALEFSLLTFIAASDTPANFAGSALQGLRVNAAETAVEFSDISGGANVISKAFADSPYQIVAADLANYDHLVVLVDASAGDTTIKYPALSVYNGKIIEVRASADPGINSIIVTDSAAAEMWTGVAIQDFYRSVSNGTIDIMQDHYESHYCLIYLGANESIAAGASEQLVTLLADVNTGGIWDLAANDLPVPFKCMVNLDFIITASGNNGLSAQVKIDAAYKVDKTMSGASNNGQAGVSLLWSAASGVKIELWAFNNYGAAVTAAAGNGAKTATQCSIKLTRLY